jgi:RNA polymerase sigma factor (sigma-70 family)
VEVLNDCLDNGTSSSWETFIALAQPVIAGAVFRAIGRCGRDRIVADDLIQDTFAKLCASNFRILRNFRGRDPAVLRAYLRVIAASVAADRFRAENLRAVSLDDPASAPQVPDYRPAQQIERELLLDRIDKCLAAQKKRDRWIFWLYHRHGLTPQAISALPVVDIGRSGVETLLYRLTRVVADCVKKFGNFPADPEGGLA